MFINQPKNWQEIGKKEVGFRISDGKENTNATRRGRAQFSSLVECELLLPLGKTDFVFSHKIITKDTHEEFQILPRKSSSNSFHQSHQPHLPDLQPEEQKITKENGRKAGSCKVTDWWCLTEVRAEERVEQ